MYANLCLSVWLWCEHGLVLDTVSWRWITHGVDQPPVPTHLLKPMEYNLALMISATTRGLVVTRRTKGKRALQVPLFCLYLLLQATLMIA